MKKLLLILTIFFGMKSYSQIYCAPYTLGCGFGDNINSFSIPSVNFNDLETGCAQDNYDDKSNLIINVNPGLSYPYEITHGAGNQYVKIWVDFNNDFDFEDAGELISSAQSNGNTTNGSFTIPANTPEGNYRMRIFTRGSGYSQSACNAGFGYGEAHDYTLHVAADAPCSPMTFGTTTIVPNCEQNQFSVSVEITALGDGQHTITDGTNSQTINNTGNYTFGPYTSDATITLTAPHGSSTSCDATVGTFTHHCAALGENCENPIIISSIPYSHSDNTANYTDSVDGSDVANNNSNCLPWQTEGNDVFYTYTPTTNQTVNFHLKNMSATEGAFQILDNCYNNTSVQCIASSYNNIGASNNLNLLGIDLIANNTYYIWVSKSAQPQTMSYTFEIETTLGTIKNEILNLEIYPNPANDWVTISNANPMDAIEIYDLNGRRVYKQSTKENLLKINIQNFAKGTYFIRVTSENKETIEQLIIK